MFFRVKKTPIFKENVDWYVKYCENYGQSYKNQSILKTNFDKKSTLYKMYSLTQYTMCFFFKFHQKSRINTSY